MNEVEIVVSGTNKFAATQAAVVKQVKGIKTAADAATGSVATMDRAVAKPKSTAIDKVTDALQKTVTTANAAADSLTKVADTSTVMDKVADSLDDAVSHAEALVAQLQRVGAESSTVASLGDAGKRAGRALARGVASGLDEARAAVAFWGGHIVSAAESTWRSAGEKINEVPKAFARAKNKIVQSVTEPFTAAVDMVTRALPDVLNSPGLMGAVAVAALPLGAAVGGAVVTGLGLGMAGIGVATAAHSSEVRTRWQQTATEVGRDWKTVAVPFRQTTMDIIGDIDQAFGSVRPKLQRTFASLAPAVSDFSDKLFFGLSRFDAFESLGKASEAVMADLGGRMPRIISGLSDDFDSLAESIERNPKALGQIVELTGKLAGSMVSDLGTLNSEFGGITEELEMIGNFFKFGKYELNVDIGLTADGQPIYSGEANEKIADIFRKITDGANETGRSTYTAKTAAEGLEGAWTNLADAGDDLAKRGSAIADMLDRIAGNTPTYEEANQQINDAIRGLRDTFADAKNHIDGYGNALINANGTVNTTTKNGSELYDTIQTLQEGFANAASSVRELEDAGWSHDAAVQKVNEDMRTQYDRLLASAGQMGLTREQMQLLLATYGLTPDFLDTIARLDDAGVRDKINDIIRTRTVLFRGVLDMSQIPNGATYKMGEYGGYGKATGGVSGGGWTTVGELGPERVKLPPGSYVQASTHSQSELAKTGAAGGGGGGVATLRVEGIPPVGTARQFLDWMAGELRANGIRVDGWTA